MRKGERGGRRQGTLISSSVLIIAADREAVGRQRPGKKKQQELRKWQEKKINGETKHTRWYIGEGGGK